MQGGPGRGIYMARRIVAAVLVLVLLVLLGYWAWQTLFKPGEEASSEAPGSANVGSTGGEEAPASETREIVVYQESPDESVESSDGVSMEGAAVGGPEAVGLAAAVVPPVVPAVPPVLAAVAAAPVPTPAVPVLGTTLPSSSPAETPKPETTAAVQVPPKPAEGPDLAAQVPSGAQKPNILPTDNQYQEARPIPYEEPTSLLVSPAAFEEGASFRVTAFEGDTSPTATTSETVAVVGSALITGSGVVAKVG